MRRCNIELRNVFCLLTKGEFLCSHVTNPDQCCLQDFEVVDNEESAEWEKEIEDMLEEENDIQ